VAWPCVSAATSVFCAADVIFASFAGTAMQAVFAATHVFGLRNKMKQLPVVSLV
jgi:hypothetical protein